MKPMLCIMLCFLLLLSGCQRTEAPETTAAASSAAQPTEPTIPPETTTQTQPVISEPVFDPDTFMDSMTVEELVGQIFLARCPSDSTAVTHIQTYHLGGYILFGRDFENKTPDSVAQTIAAYQAASAVPLLIAVDEEGGSVTRVSSQSAFRSSRFSSPRELFSQGGMELLTDTEAEKAQLLHALGINVNMAPVCDISTDPAAFMYSRSLGQSPELTGQCIAAMVQTMSAEHIGSVLKHFPGYGNNADTHTGMATDSRSLEALQACDLVPFQYGIDAGCGAILVSHTIVGCLDDTLPASLSPAVIGYLRNTMGFNGVVVTDDLVMQAITDTYGTGEAAVLAVLAGNDLLCSTEYSAQYAAVLQAVNSGRIPLEQLKASVARILLWKYQLGLLQID